VWLEESFTPHGKLAWSNRLLPGIAFLPVGTSPWLHAEGERFWGADVNV
jgi:hypothetical protein